MASDINSRPRPSSGPRLWRLRDARARVWRSALLAGAVLVGASLMLATEAAAQCIATTCTVNSASDLVTAITTVDNNPNTSYVINFRSTVTLTSSSSNTLPAIITSSTVTINGGNFTLDGGSVQRGFFVYSGTVAIDNLTIQNAQALGGAGGRASC